MATIPTATVTFAKDATSITLASPPPGYRVEDKIAQAIGRTATGSVRVYDKDVETRTLALVLVVTLAELTSLVAFFRTTIDGSLNTFSYTDHLGVTHATVRLANPVLQYTKTPGGRYAVPIALFVASDPT